MYYDHINIIMSLCRASLGSLAVISDPTQLEHTLGKWLACLEKLWDDEGSHDAFPARLVVKCCVCLCTAVTKCMEKY